MPESIRYEKRFGEFVLLHDLNYSEPEVLYSGKEVAIGFTYYPKESSGARTLTHRHGDPVGVGGWVQQQQAANERIRFLNLGFEDWDLPYMISTDQWDLEDLNRIISTTGYLEVVLKKLGIELTPRING